MFFPLMWTDRQTAVGSLALLSVNNVWITPCSASILQLDPVTSCHILSHAVTSCHMLSHPVTSCHILSHAVTSCHMLSHPVTCCHMLSHPVTCCHILSHAVTSCHVLSHAVTCCLPSVMQYTKLCHICVAAEPGCRVAVWLQLPVSAGWLLQQSKGFEGE